MVEQLAAHSYRDLKVWQRGVDLVIDCYEVTDRLPPSERYDLARQIRRSAVSIPSNIAEGHGRDHIGDYLRHLSFANGSLMELETQLWIAHRLKFIDQSVVDALLASTAELGRMLSGLTRRLKERRDHPKP